jgi:glycine dehydrogenase subunit 1
LGYVPHTDADRQAMLDAIGVERLEDLFADVPQDRRFPDLALPPKSSELEVERELRELAARNVDGTQRPCFLGAGSARHYVPATVDAVLRRGEFYSSYTPYQPELSQGFLQATFEYQSMICRLTGMDVSTATASWSRPRCTPSTARCWRPTWLAPRRCSSWARPPTRMRAGWRHASIAAARPA